MTTITQDQWNDMVQTSQNTITDLQKQFEQQTALLNDLAKSWISHSEHIKEKDELNHCRNIELDSYLYEKHGNELLDILNK